MRGPSVVVAGGGSAGHIEPALAFADAVRRLRPDARVTALGTERGLDTTLIPARGYPLELIPPVPLPRRPSADLLRLPGRVRGAITRVREVLDATAADVVVGFGGYVALPAYLGARGRVPIVVHEANARAGLANKVGARFAELVAVAVAGTGLPGEQVVGMPLRRSITTLDRPGLRAQARQAFGLPPQGPVLLVFGGSQGARTLNAAVADALPGLLRAGIAVLHAHGKGGQPAPPARGYVAMPYIDRMDLAYAAADALLGRCGMTTVAEVTAVGMPAVYVPLPHGNGEQALNAAPVVAAGGGVLVDDAELTGQRALAELLPILTNGPRLAGMSRAARASGHADADERLARLVLGLLPRGGPGAARGGPEQPTEAVRRPAPRAPRPPKQATERLRAEPRGRIPQDPPTQAVRRPGPPAAGRPEQATELLRPAPPSRGEGDRPTEVLRPDPRVRKDR